MKEWVTEKKDAKRESDKAKMNDETHRDDMRLLEPDESGIFVPDSHPDSHQSAA